MKNLVTRYPIVFFVLITFFISYPIQIILSFVFPKPVSGQFSPHAYVPQIIGTYGPAIAAILVTSTTLGTAAVKQLLLTLKPKVAHAGYWLLLPLSGFIITGLAFVTTGVPIGQIIKMLANYPGDLLFLFIIVTIKVGIGEELGWRGWLLPQLIKRNSPIKATLVLFVIWALWHPILFGGSYRILAPFLLYLFSVGFLFTWLWHKINGNIFIIAIAHSSVDFPEFFIENHLRGTLYENRILAAWAILSVLFALMAIAIYIRNKKWWHTFYITD